MDEMIRIYHPEASKTVVDELKEASRERSPKKPSRNHMKNSKWNFLGDETIWKEILAEESKKRKELNQKYPWFEILYNWKLALCVTALFVSFIIWGVNIRTEQTAVAYATAAVAQKEAEYQAIRDQEEADRKAEEESLQKKMIHNAQLKAQIGYGSRNFIDKYHYGDDDFMTLYQCIDNRLKNPIYSGMTIDEIVNQEKQWVGYFQSNPIQDYYYNLAMRSEEATHTRVSQPVGSDYIYAIYTEHGIYLANDPDAPAYTWWHYSG